MSRSERPLAVFDVDGTLVDSRAIIHRAAVEGARAAGLAEPGYEAVRRIVGLSLPQALAELVPGLAPATHHAFVEGYKAAFRAMAAAPDFHEPLYPGAAELLRRLQREGWRLAIATGKSRPGVARIVEMHGWGEVFASTHCADDGPGKPHPHMLRCAMAEAGAGPARTVMIGDTSHDMAMAVAAGTRAQGVAWGFHTPDEVAAGGADHVAGDFAALEAALDRFAARLEA